MTTPITTQPDALHRNYLQFTRGDVTLTAIPSTTIALAADRAKKQADQAGYFQHLTAVAIGLGYPSAIDAMAALTAILKTPTIYVRAETIAGLKNPRNNGVSACLSKLPLPGRVGFRMVPVAKGGAA